MTLPSRDVALDRRGFLASAAALPMLQLSCAPARGPLRLAEALARAHELVAVHLAGEPGNDEAWAHAAGSLLAQVDELPGDPFGAMTAQERAFLAAHGWTFRRVDGVPADRRPAVITHQIHVPPGGRIALHDHRGMFGAIVCAAGDVEIRSFDVVEGSAATAVVTLREMDRAWLAPRRFSLLTRTRDNVHEFRAGPDGARLIDLFVWLDEGARSHELAWVDDPNGAPRDRRYRARWA